MSRVPRSAFGLVGFPTVVRSACKQTIDTSGGQEFDRLVHWHRLK
jgi:hypothetical protein